MLQQPYRSLKETEARIGEIFRLKWDNIDFESRTIKITPKKFGKARSLFKCRTSYRKLRQLFKLGMVSRSRKRKWVVTGLVVAPPVGLE